ELTEAQFKGTRRELWKSPLRKTCPWWSAPLALWRIATVPGRFEPLRRAGLGAAPQELRAAKFNSLRYLLHEIMVRTRLAPACWHVTSAFTVAKPSGEHRLLHNLDVYGGRFYRWLWQEIGHTFDRRYAHGYSKGKRREAAIMTVELLRHRMATAGISCNTDFYDLTNAFACCEHRDLLHYLWERTYPVTNPVDANRKSHGTYTIYKRHAAARSYAANDGKLVSLPHFVGKRADAYQWIVHRVPGILAGAVSGAARYLGPHLAFDGSLGLERVRRVAAARAAYAAYNKFWHNNGPRRWARILFQGSVTSMLTTGLAAFAPSQADLKVLDRCKDQLLRKVATVADSADLEHAADDPRLLFLDEYVKDAFCRLDMAILTARELHHREIPPPHAAALPLTEAAAPLAPGGWRTVYTCTIATDTGEERGRSFETYRQLRAHQTAARGCPGTSHCPSAFLSACRAAFRAMEQWQQALGAAATPAIEPPAGKKGRCGQERLHCEWMKTADKLSLDSAQDVARIAALAYFSYDVPKDGEIDKAVTGAARARNDKYKGQSGHNGGSPHAHSFIALLLALHGHGDPEHKKNIETFMGGFSPENRHIQQVVGCCVRQQAFKSDRRKLFFKLLRAPGLTEADKNVLEDIVDKLLTTNGAVRKLGRAPRGSLERRAQQLLDLISQGKSDADLAAVDGGKGAFTEES
ncbi:unnamed protein product, partial [Prorocentrum cordatum]